MFSLIIFIIVLGLLVFAHEAGHFFAARKSGMDVEEFGFGFPPRAFGIQRKHGKWHIVGARTEWKEGEPTIYSLNWLPLGGFVRIKGESGGDAKDSGSFVGQSRWRRAIVLVAGVAMNVILSFVLFTVVFAVGAPQVVDSLPENARVRDVKTTIVGVLEGSPADDAGFMVGDVVLSVSGKSFIDPDAVSVFIQENLDEKLAVIVERDDAEVALSVTPGPLSGTERQGLGVQLVKTGVVAYPIYQAAWEGLKTTGFVITEIARALGNLVLGLFSDQVVAVDIAGPVGIAVLTGQVARLGIMHLLQFTAILSANLAFINIFPFPALDGGRLFFLALEAIRRRSLTRRVENTIHAVGFAILIGLVLLVTYRDVVTFGGGFFNTIRSSVGL